MRLMNLVMTSTPLRLWAGGYLTIVMHPHVVTRPRAFAIVMRRHFSTRSPDAKFGVEEILGSES